MKDGPQTWVAPGRPGLAFRGQPRSQLYELPLLQPKKLQMISALNSRIQFP